MRESDFSEGTPDSTLALAVPYIWECCIGVPPSVVSHLLAMLRRRGFLIPFWARTRALHYLAGSYELSDELRHQLTQLVYGYAGRCDEEAARSGMKWLRERDREIGEIESLLWGGFVRKYFPQRGAEEDRSR